MKTLLALLFIGCILAVLVIVVIDINKRVNDYLADKRRELDRIKNINKSLTTTEKKL